MQKTTDPVRASRDGHEFHEAWAARRALQLVFPADDLVGMAIEGLVTHDRRGAARETIEIADVVLYYGPAPRFERANKVVIAQLKYSIAKKAVHLRQAEIKQTIQKFAEAFRDHRRRFGDEAVEAKLAFELVTNRPIDPEFESAIQNYVQKRTQSGGTKKYVAQLAEMSGFSGSDLIRFASKLKLVGLAGNLETTKRDVTSLLVDWSAAADTMSRARLGGLRQLVRDKAGSAGQQDNLIRRTDVLSALDVQGPEDLLPCPAAFASVGKVVERTQLADAVKKIPSLDRPLVVHAAGGIGKTVFIQSLAQSLSVLVGSSRVDLQACKLEYSIVSPK